MEMFVDDVDTVVDRALVTPLYQPIVDLRTGRVAAHEALTRGPAGSLHSPDRLFAAARSGRRVGELDELCRRVAIRTALAGSHRPDTLFLNVEPDGIPLGGPPPELAAFRSLGGHVVMEFTERALTEDPARVLWFAERLRHIGVAVALDDVGSHPDSLALMPFLRPEVVKLDMRLVQHAIDDRAAMVLTAVGSYAERKNAIVLAEGIETEEHARTARALGATLGQGWLFGRPEVLRAGGPRRPPSPALVTPRRPGIGGDASPFETVASSRAVRRGGVREVETAARVLEKRALGAEGSTVLLACGGPYGGPSTRRLERFAGAARLLPLVGLLGVDRVPAGVRGADLAPDDPLRAEWDVAIVGPHVATALVARRAEHPSGPDARELDYTVVHDRDLVLGIARSLMSRIVPSPATAPPAPLVV